MNIIISTMSALSANIFDDGYFVNCYHPSTNVFFRYSELTSFLSPIIEILGDAMLKNDDSDVSSDLRCFSKIQIRSPHNPEVHSSNLGKKNTSDFSIRDPLSLPSCDWYRIYLAMLWISSVGRAADLKYTCQARCHGFDSRCFPHI